MRLRHIEVINAIRITSTLNAAAQLLSMTQPSVSQILQSAEQQLGYQLFTRVKGRLIPTKEALLLFPEMQKLDNQLNAVQRMANSLKKGDTCEMRIIAAPALIQTIVPASLASMLDESQGLRVTLSPDCSAAATASLALLEADVGILYYTPKHPGIDTVELGVSHYMAVGPPDWKPDARDISLEQLVGERLVGPDLSDVMGMILAQVLAERDLHLDIAIACRSYHGRIALIERGQGIGIVDAVSAADALCRGLRVIPISPSIGIPIVASRPLIGMHSIYVEKLIANCRQQVAEHNALFLHPQQQTNLQDR